jgi:phage terminase large subunit-like protein
LRAARERLRQVAEFERLADYKPYPKQLLFHALGKTNRVRGLFGGNQTGKSICGGAETAMHLTGEYPEDWPGHRFEKGILCWASGETGEATRDNPQTKLIGPPDQEERWGSGFIPRRRILDVSRAIGTRNLLDTVTIRHASGDTSTLWFKRYEQGRAKWQGPSLEFVWFDEEPPWDIWSEGFTRTNARERARIIATFTALKGYSELVAWLMRKA